MNVDYFKLLYDYTYWARDRILATAAGLSDEDYARPNGFTYDGLQSMLTHLLSAESLWLSRYINEEPIPIRAEDVSGLKELTSRWQVEEARMRDFLASLTESRLQEDVVVRRRTGEERRAPLWLLLTQVANHGTQHRSEAAEALTMIGRSPGGLDLTAFYWESRVKAT